MLEFECDSEERLEFSRSIDLTFRYSFIGDSTRFPNADPTSTTPSRKADVVAVIGSQRRFSIEMGLGLYLQIDSHQLKIPLALEET